MSDTKPRKMQVNIHIKKGDSLVGEWNGVDQKLIFKVLRNNAVVSAKKVQLTTYYDRKAKPKYLNRVEFGSSSDFTVSHIEELQNYDQVWAIDTNRRTIFSKNANVSAVTVLATDGSQVYLTALALIFGKTMGNPELFGWRKFIEFIKNTSEYNANARYGLVVDSELDLLPHINDREIPIHGNFFLPDNWSLIYATSDSGKEFIINRLISESDKISSAVLDLISTKESNAKHWDPIEDEEEAFPTFLPLKKRDGG